MTPNVWFIALGIAVVAALGQTWRLHNAQGKITVFEERERAQIAAQAKRELNNVKAKERADENYLAARNRARRVVVRYEPAPRIAVGTIAPRSGDKAAECISRGDVDRVVADFEREHAAGLDAVIAGVSQRHAAEATHIAGDTETVAAAFRSCRGYALEAE
jgi:hypothetical protein